MPVEPTAATSPPAAAPSGRMRRWAPVPALLVLAPWAAECSWGGFTASGFLLVVVFLGPLYGGAAILIRETARRTGGGWPAVVLLAMGFGVFQAGVVDQSLFNPGYLDDTEFADFGAAGSATLIPGLGVSAEQVVSYVGNHVALSICAPIAIVESFIRPPRRSQPWLGRRGLLGIGLLYVLGSLLIFSDDSGRKDFMADPRQLAVAAALVVLLVGAALLPRWERGRGQGRQDGRAPAAVWVGLVAFAAHVSSGHVPGWTGVAIHLAVAGGAVAIVVAWSRRAGWDQRHVLAAWGAGLVAAAGTAYLVPNYAPASPTEALVGDLAISVVTLSLLGGALWRLRRCGHPPAEAPVHGP